MAGDWIKMRTNLDTDPAVVRISSRLKSDRFATVGRLHRIWAWANEHLTDGQDVPIDSVFLDQLVDCSGFAEAMRHVGWLTGRDGFLCFPSFERHNGASAKARALDADRKRESRKTSEKRPAQNRTQTGLEKRREEKSIKKEKNGCDPIISAYLENEEFRDLWEAFKAMVAQTHDYAVEAIQEQFQLSELERMPIDEAKDAIRFSISKGAKSPIVNGDHRKRKAPSQKPKQEISM